MEKRKITVYKGLKRLRALCNENDEKIDFVIQNVSKFACRRISANGFICLKDILENLNYDVTIQDLRVGYTNEKDVCIEIITLSSYAPITVYLEIKNLEELF